MKRGATKPTGFLMLTTLLAMVLGFSLAALALQGGPFPASASMLDNASSPEAPLQVAGDSLDDLDIALTPGIAVNEAGTPHTVTATVTGTGNQLTPNIEVLFDVVMGASEGVTGSGVTDADGSVDFTFTSQTEGFDIIQACITDGSENFACDLAFKVWTQPEPQFDITLEPERAQNPLGTEHTVTATVTGTGTDPVTGAQVNFEVASGPTAGATGSAVTDLNGQADFTYEGAGTGQDIIHACVEDSNGVESCARAAKTWTDREDPPRTSCRGENSCQGQNISVGENSCNAEDACNGNNIVIGDDSCNGEESCRGNRTTVGSGSCNEEESCNGNNGRIGNQSCNGEEACEGHNIAIGNGSCNAEEACVGHNNSVGDNTCNQEEACSGRGNQGNSNSQSQGNNGNGNSQGRGQGQGNSGRGGRP